VHRCASQRAATFQQACLTDLLQEMIDLGLPVHAQVVGSAWKEIDTIEDYEAALRLLRHRDRAACASPPRVDASPGSAAGPRGAQQAAPGAIPPRPR
jgi:NDP-sugar pyrophosphorylase family protein